MMRRWGLLFLSAVAPLAACHAQTFPPGRLMQIRKVRKYPFNLLTLDSIVGQRYYLTRPFIGIAPTNLSSVQRSNENRLMRVHSNENRLRAIFLKQPVERTILAPLVGAEFQIVSYEYDTLDKYFHQLYILAQFESGQSVVIPVEYSSLIGTIPSLVPAPILDSARRRWVGRSLWMNSTEGTDAPPRFSEVKVMRIEPSSASHGFLNPYEFHVEFGNGDTANLACVLQPQDSSQYALKGTAFGQLFLDRSPDYYWRTIPDTGFANGGIALGEDSAMFTMKLRELGINIVSYSSHFLPSAEESSMTLGLSGSGLWGMPLDSATADFHYGKLVGLSFAIYNSIRLSAVERLLQQRYGQPSSRDSLSTVAQLDTWMYYSPTKSISSVVLMRLGSLVGALGKLASFDAQTTTHLPIAMVTLGMDGS